MKDIFSISELVIINYFVQLKHSGNIQKNYEQEITIWHSFISNSWFLFMYE